MNNHNHRKSNFWLSFFVICIVENKMNSVEKSEDKTKIIQIALTKREIPALWESLKIVDGLCRSTVIVQSNGKLSHSIYQKKQILEDGKQNLVPVQKGNFIIKAFKEESGIGVSVFEIKNIRKNSRSSLIKLVLRKNTENEWDEWELFDENICAVVETGIHAALEKLEDASLVVNVPKKKQVYTTSTQT